MELPLVSQANFGRLCPFLVPFPKAKSYIIDCLRSNITLDFRLYNRYCASAPVLERFQS